ncbi:hypothetical protein OSTOST_13084, partial [Ostertagia ostertagi]
FVYENAENIGADASRITAWGLSAGGAAVGQLALSPVSRDYITRSIEMSGSPWAAWALGPNVPTYSLELAEGLGCNGDLKNCMKQRTVEEIYDAVENVWGPVIDGEFLQDPDEMTATAPPKDSIIGISDKEAAFFTIKARSPFINEFGVQLDEFRTWDREKLIATIKELIRPEFFAENWDKVVDEVVAHYVDRDEENAYDFYLDRYTEVIKRCDVQCASTRRGRGWNLFAYSFNHYNKAIWPDEIPERLKGPIIKESEQVQYPGIH